jgi:integrase
MTIRLLSMSATLKLMTFAANEAGRPTPRGANKAVAVMRLLLSWAVDHGWRTDKPALRPGRLRTGPGYPTWTAEHLATFLACAAIGELLKRAAVLDYYTGMRVSDCLTLTKAARREGVIEVVPAKTSHSSRARVCIPEHPDLTGGLDAAPSSDATTLLTRADGKPWGIDHFKHSFGVVAWTAGLPGLSFHGLRKGLPAALANNGATDAEIEALIPHTDGRLTRHYRAEADQARLARSAIAKLPAAQAKIAHNFDDVQNQTDKSGPRPPRGKPPHRGARRVLSAKDSVLGSNYHYKIA